MASAEPLAPYSELDSDDGAPRSTLRKDCAAILAKARDRDGRISVLDLLVCSKCTFLHVACSTAVYLAIAVFVLLTSLAGGAAIARGSTGLALGVNLGVLLPLLVLIGFLVYKKGGKEDWLVVVAAFGTTLLTVLLTGARAPPAGGGGGGALIRRALRIHGPEHRKRRWNRGVRHSGGPFATLAGGRRCAR